MMPKIIFFLHLWPVGGLGLCIKLSFLCQFSVPYSLCRIYASCGFIKVWHEVFQSPSDVFCLSLSRLSSPPFVEKLFTFLIFFKDICLSLVRVISSYILGESPFGECLERSCIGIVLYH